MPHDPALRPFRRVRRVSVAGRRLPRAAGPQARAARGAARPRAVPRGLPAVAPVVPMPVGDDGMPWEFRHKAAFVFGDGPRGLVMGHYAAGGRDIVPVSECPVHGARANRIAFRLHDELARARVTGRRTAARRRAAPRDRPDQRRRARRRGAAGRHAQRPVAAPAGAGAAGVGRSPRRVLPEHPRSAVAVHGRPHDDPPRGPRARPRAADRADVPGLADRVLPDQPGGRRGAGGPRAGAGRPASGCGSSTSMPAAASSACRWRCAATR